MEAVEVKGLHETGWHFINLKQAEKQVGYIVWLRYNKAPSVLRLTT